MQELHLHSPDTLNRSTTGQFDDRRVTVLSFDSHVTAAMLTVPCPPLRSLSHKVEAYPQPPVGLYSPRI